MQAGQGSVHHSRIFKNSLLFQNFISGEMGNGVLLGDSGYALAPFLLTPISNPSSTSERQFNSCHAKTRVKIEQAFWPIKKALFLSRNQTANANRTHSQSNSSLLFAAQLG